MRGATPANSTAGVRRYYDRHTARFIAYGQGGGEGAIHRAVWGAGVTTREQAFHYVDDRLSEVLRTLSPSDRSRHIVDLGCGVGASLCYLARQLPIVGTGVTLSPVQARLARARIHAADLTDRLRCVEGDFTDLTLELPHADMVFAIESFVHNANPTAFFKQCARIVRPGGLLVICDDMRRPTTDVAARRVVARFRRGWHIHTLVGRDELRRLAAAAGFAHRSTDDLTPHLELGRPRDRALALLAALIGWLPIDPILGHVTGGSALHTCLERGWIGYDLALFRRSE